MALQRRVVRGARLRRHHLYGARVRQLPEPRLHRPDRARLTQLRDQRLPAPRMPGDGGLQRAGQAFDDVTPVEIDPDGIVTTGGSYGGGFSWMALTDPK